MRLKILYLIAVVFLLNGTAIKAQEKISYTKADSLTYAHYMNGNWNELIKVGNTALDADIDYFYLRMRIAYAYFQKQQYRKAINHYQQALKQNPVDLNALYYLMYSYEYGGRMTDAVALSYKIDSIQLPDLFNRYKKPVLAGGLFYNYNKGNSSSLTKQLSNYSPSGEGIQKATDSYHMASGFMSHRLGRYIIVNHQISFMSKNEYSLSVFDGVKYEVPNQNVTQFNYNIQATITFAKGFTVTPVYNFVKIRIPFDNISIPAYTESATVGGVILNQQLKLFSAGTSISSGTVNNLKQTQFGGHFTFYPLANLNLYYSFNGFLQQQDNYGTTENTFIHKHLIGFKAANHWWIEASAIPTEFNNFYNPLSGALWNGLERTKNVVNLSNIFMLKNYKTSFLLSVGMYDSVSEFKPHTSAGNHQNQNKYTNYNITAGISWKL